MATTPIISPPTSSSSTIHRKTRSIQQYQQQQQQPFSPPSSAGRNSTTQHGNTIATPATTPPPPPLKQQQQTSTGGVESPRFRLSKLLAPLQTHHLHSRSEQDQQQLQSPLSPQQQHQHHQQAPHHHHHAHNHSHRLFSSKHANPASRFRRGGGGGFLGFLQSHYHAFHRSQDQQQQHQATTGVNGGTTNVDKRDNAAVEREREQQRRRRAITAVSPRSPPEGRGLSFMSNMYSGNNYTSASSNNHNSSSSSAGTVHSGYNITISDFRAHATIASTRSETLPTKVTDVVFERRGSFKNRDSAVATPPTTPPPIPNTNGGGGGGGFRASLRSLGILGPVISSSSSPCPPLTATATPTQPRSPSSPPHSPTLSATTPLPLPASVHPQVDAVSSLSSSSSPSPKQRRMSGQGFFSKDKDRSSRDDSPSSSPSTSKLASKGWVGRMAFLYSKRKPSLPLQSHYLSLPVGGAAVTSPTAGTGGMYMHSEDLSVTEFAKLAGITIVQDEDDPTTYDSQIIGNEIHERCRRGSSTTELTPPPSGGLLGPEYGTLGSTGNTLNSERNLTVGSNGSFGGGSLRKTQIWDPQFWSDPVRDGVTTTSTNAMVSINKMLLPSASTSSLPITSGSSATRPPVPAPIGNSAPNSPRLKPQSSLPSSAPSYGASPSLSRLGPATTPSTLPPPVPAHQQRRRNSCSPTVLMPAAGSRVAETAITGPEIDRAQHLTSSGVLSLKRADQQQQQSPRPGSKDAIQLSQDLGRRRSFTSLTAVALELEGGSGESGQTDGVQDVLQAGGVAVDGGPTVASSMPCLVLEPSTPTAPAKTSQLAVPPPPPSMSHTLAMHALHTPRSRGSVPGGSGGGHSSRTGVSRTRSPSPSPLSRQIDLGSLESPQEEKGDPLDRPQKRETTDSSLAQLSPLPLVSSPPASKSSRQCPAHGKSGKNATKPSMSTKGPGSANKHLTATATPPAIGPVVHHHQRGQSMPLSLSDQQSTNTQHHRPPQARTPPPPPSSSASSTTASSSRSNSPSPSPSPSGRIFTPGTKVGRFTLVQERCTKHVDLLKAQQAQRRASLGEMGLLPNGASGGKTEMYLSPTSSCSTSSLAEDAVLDAAEWVENPMLKPEENVRVFQRKRSRRILDPLPQSQPQPQHPLSRPPPVSY